ncbi:MAG: recombination mediator RecR [bacterium]|nr:recombination mediator RecR [bacterium]
MQFYAPAIEKLVNELQKLPGIGQKTAQRLTYHLLKSSPEQVQSLSEAIAGIIGKIKHCTVCNNLTESERCSICADPNRDTSVICVVEQPFDILAFERTRAFNGVYHVLLGALSPIDGITPDDLTIASLLARVQRGGVKEVILGTNPDTEGEATAAYLVNVLRPFNITISRLGVGVPIGGDLEYADEVTLSRALEGRRRI